MTAKMGAPCDLPALYDLLAPLFGLVFPTTCGRPASIPLVGGGYVCLEHAREMADDPEKIDPEFVRRHSYLFEGGDS